MKLFFSRRENKDGASAIKFTPMISGHNFTLVILLIFVLTQLLCLKSIAQTNTAIKPDSTRKRFYELQCKGLTIDLREPVTDPNHYSIPIKQINTRVKLVTAGNVLGYSGILYGLSKEWYANYPKSKFHSFNDNSEWLQIDKVGHMYGAYIESRASMELWRWTGIGRKQRIWIGGLSGAVYQTVIEVLDGYSAQWGWSWGDFSANVFGSGVLIAQELAWDDQRIKIKFSFHKNDYKDAGLNKRADEIYGKTLAERFIKDYNAQTYWASANVKSFFPKTKLPGWFSIAVGYGGGGMFGANDNYAKDSSGIVTFDRRDIKRYRQWYLAPDIDLTKIKTNKKAVKFLLTVLSAFKFPLPSIEFSNGSFKLNAISF